MTVDLLHCEYCAWLTTWIIKGKSFDRCHKLKHEVKNHEVEYCDKYEENYPAKQIKRWAAERAELEAKENKERDKERATQMDLFLYAEMNAQEDQPTE